jgi:sigma-B regulation protein RsbU (phosphoserine phosphatase)
MAQASAQLVAPDAPGKRRSGWDQARFAAAVLFSVATILYSALWMYYVRRTPKAGLGLTPRALQGQPGLLISETSPGGPAEAAGLKPGDKILAVDGAPLLTIAPYLHVVLDGHPGQSVLLKVVRVDAAAPRQVRVVLGPVASTPLVAKLLESYPIPFVVVAIPLLFLRLRDRNAWLLAAGFAGFIAQAPNLYLLAPSYQLHFALAYSTVFYSLGPAAFAYLFLVFPVSSPLDRRLPWLKWAFVILAVADLTSAGTLALLPIGFLFRFPLLRLTVRLLFSYFFPIMRPGAFLVGLVSLVLNAVCSRDPEARRKARVMVWGTVAGLAPSSLLALLVIFTRLNVYSLPTGLWAATPLALFLMPLSFAYAVVKHRVLEIPVLLRRSARYLLVQRGFILLLIVTGLAATTELARAFARHYPNSSAAAIPAGAVFGAALIGLGSWMHNRVRKYLDRAFFRSSYDASLILQDLVDKTREVRTRDQLCVLLERSLRDALHPEFLGLYLQDRGPLSLRAGAAAAAPSILEDSSFLREVFAHGHPIEATERMPLGPLHAECLVPLLGRDRRPMGLLVLGPRLSEEPYSGQDKRMLASVASQAGATLENIQLGEEIAERIAADERSAHELELARQVQRKLFPQNQPVLATLDYAGDCVQARRVGGDYYDFLALAPGCVGLVVADISGKGFSAALLMANLQANLRSQYAVAYHDLPSLLKSANQIFFENTEPNHYATMFFGIYDDAQRSLRYVNCGHNPPLVLRANGDLERLSATATIMGMFLDWECEVGEISLHPGDRFAIYTDGITEAEAPNGEEFGEDRLVRTLRELSGKPAAIVLKETIAAVQVFSPAEQTDDLTLVIGSVK